ncbi:hypothetical protein Pcinc_005966 [Petrolisthes cinctipes]|uniref:Uncharacterized protein n=1 Tax=Petrolisthes cinctipes TaxID=88211 RepID=A0AAE1GDR7_PETCI|nr:hypothetical protein Pcinc_005966 [Petrolisthes cinctipes]
MADVKGWAKFPSAKVESKRRKLWESRCRRSEGWKATRYHRISSRHFVDWLGLGPSSSNPDPELFQYNDWGRKCAHPRPSNAWQNKNKSDDRGQADTITPQEPMPDVSENGGGINLHRSVQQSSFIEDVPEPHPHADFYALPQEPVAEITISEIGGGVDLHNSLQEFSVAEVTPVPHPDHTYLCTSQDGADFGQPADVGIQIGQPTIDAETQTLDMVY